MIRLQNSLSVEYKNQKSVINEFDEALKKEENIEKELRDAKVAVEEIEFKMKAAFQKAAVIERKKIQEKMRISALKTANGLRDPGNIIFLSLSCLNLI
jgi:predicted nucleic acid-binding protein